MKKHGGNLNAYYKAKETNLKKLHTVKRQNYGDSKKISGCQG